MLKMKNVKRFGQKLTGFGKQLGRKITQVSKAVEAVGVPIATAIGGPEAGLAVKGASESAQKIGRGVERLSGKVASKSQKVFKQIQNPVLGVQEIARQAQGAMKNPEQAQIMIGETIARRFPSKSNPDIQRTDQPVNDWAPDLPYAGM